VGPLPASLYKGTGVMRIPLPKKLPSREAIGQGKSKICASRNDELNDQHRVSEGVSHSRRSGGDKKHLEVLKGTSERGNSKNANRQGVVKSTHEGSQGIMGIRKLGLKEVDRGSRKFITAKAKGIKTVSSTRSQLSKRDTQGKRCQRREWLKGEQKVSENRIRKSGEMRNILGMTLGPEKILDQRTLLETRKSGGGGVLKIGSRQQAGGNLPQRGNCHLLSSPLE